MDKCIDCKCSTCIHRCNETFEKENKLDCTMCDWCKFDLIKHECNLYDSGLTAENFKNIVVSFDS